VTFLYLDFLDATGTMYSMASTIDKELPGGLLVTSWRQSSVVLSIEDGSRVRELSCCCLYLLLRVLARGNQWQPCGWVPARPRPAKRSNCLRTAYAVSPGVTHDPLHAARCVR
jgi:hypothetical protein